MFVYINDCKANGSQYKDLGLCIGLPCLLMRSPVRRWKQSNTVQSILLCQGLFSHYFIGCCYELWWYEDIWQIFVLYIYFLVCL